ncbi:uncharacterized protein [Prorops nasuta]|uniref:uncharacterized protein isoform X2 n=1 Tax=Prorops nasuta TaxID=863751 RepID=UPI0034D00B04
MAATWRMKPVASALALLAIASLPFITIIAQASEAEMGADEHGINLPDGSAVGAEEDEPGKSKDLRVPVKKLANPIGNCTRLQEKLFQRIDQDASGNSSRRTEVAELQDFSDLDEEGDFSSGNESRSNRGDLEECGSTVGNSSEGVEMEIVAGGWKWSERGKSRVPVGATLENDGISELGLGPTTMDFPSEVPTVSSQPAPRGIEEVRWSAGNSISPPPLSVPGLDNRNKTLPFAAFRRNTKTDDDDLVGGFGAPDVDTAEGRGVLATTAIGWTLVERKVNRKEIVPGSGNSTEVEAGRRTSKDEKLQDTKKDHSRPLNNLLLGSSKSSKAFYEIRPSIRSEMENRIGLAASPTPRSPRKFVLPSGDRSFGKFGPFFEDGDKEMNVTARIGSTVLLDCKIGMLADKQVTWLQHNKDSFRLLTVGRTAYSLDQRISLNFRYPSNWRLQILYATPRDSGLYKCQVATHPPLVKKINVLVTAPRLTISDDFGRVVPKERHLKAGSALKLRCEARDVLESQNESVIWTRGDETLVDDVSENRTTEVSSGKEILVIVSTLIVEKATPRHAGNYSCVVPGKAKTTITVHVLNGELPAAVHDGSGVSRAVLNLWLIHLTVSYVFSR